MLLAAVGKPLMSGKFSPPAMAIDGNRRLHLAIGELIDTAMAEPIEKQMT
jgi:hypothetical protein